MFSFRDFLKKGFMSAVGKMADYKIILNASGYFEKGVLTETDLSEIQTAIENQYVVPEIIPDETSETGDPAETIEPDVVG